VAPTASAYNDLKRVAETIRDENAGTFSGATIIIYDAQAFGAIGMYPGSVQQLRTAMRSMCDLTEPGLVSAEAASDVLSGAGTAASGLAALINAVTPAFAIQGQAFTIDNNALIAAFIRTVGQEVVIPAYLPAATPSTVPSCGDAQKSGSFTSLWVSAEAESFRVKAKINAAKTDSEKKALQTALDSYQAMRDGYLSTDKGASLYSKMSLAETLDNILRPAANNRPLIIDMKIDAAGIDSTTQTILFWRSTKFSDNVLVHYFVYAFEPGNKLHLKNANIVTIVTQDKDLKDYLTAEQRPKQNSRGSASSKPGQPTLPHGY
jgi:hypothetical protein